MPYTETKVKGGYKVAGPGGVHMKSGTKANAEAQMRLLHGVEHGWKPTGKKGRSDQGGHMGMGSPPAYEKFSNPDKY